MTDEQTKSRITKGYKQLVAEATESVDMYSTVDAIKRFNNDDVIFVDVRDTAERLEHGEIPGSIHASRGMLEFHIDPESPYFIEEFGAEKEFLFHCAVGSRSALATQRAKEMGLNRVANIEGGFNAWKEAGGQVDRPRPMM